MDLLAQMERELDAEWLAEWRREVEEWETDRTKANPYEPRVQGMQHGFSITILQLSDLEMSQVDVRLMLAQQDASRKEGDSYSSSVTASGMLVLGLELEEAQCVNMLCGLRGQTLTVQRCRLREDMAATGLHPTALQQAKFLERCNTVNRCLDAWTHVQAFFTPGVVLLRTLDAQRTSSTASEPKAFDRRLYLPSEIIGLPDRAEFRAATHMDPSLMETEWLLREAQAKDALASIRSHLRVDSYLMKHKHDQVRGVSQNTRSQILIKQNLARVKMAVMKYRTAHNALINLERPLNRNSSWKTILRKLEETDVVGLLVAGIGEGRRQLSWIWLAPGSLDAGEGEKSEKVQDGTYLVSTSLFTFDEYS